MENFIAPTQTEAAASKQPCTRHDVFQSLLSDESIKYDATAAAHIKHIIELMKQYRIISAKLNSLWESKDFCAEHYRCSTILYLI